MTLTATKIIMRDYFRIVIASGMLALATLACMLNSPESLNDGQGTRSNPVPALQHAKTSDYDVRAQAVVRPMEGIASDTESDADNVEYMRVQFQVRCTKSSEEICDLSQIGEELMLVDSAGVIHSRVLGVEVDQPLSGEILGEAEDAGWQVYEVPEGLEVSLAMAEYDSEYRVFFNLPQ